MTDQTLKMVSNKQEAKVKVCRNNVKILNAAFQ